MTTITDIFHAGHGKRVVFIPTTTLLKVFFLGSGITRFNLFKMYCLEYFRFIQEQYT